MKVGLKTRIKRWTAEITDGTLLAGGADIKLLDLERDFPDVERLLLLEEWPFVRGDLEISHAQPGCANGAWKDGVFAGFFSTHCFGEIGYLDMMIVDARFRRGSIARPLYFQTLRELIRRKQKTFVLHTTNDSARIISLLGFKATDVDFTLVARAPSIELVITGDGNLGERTHSEHGTIREMLRTEDGHSLLDIESVIALDAEVFGMKRPEWIHALARQPGCKFVASYNNERLSSLVCLRPRRNDAYCLDLCAAYDLHELPALISYVVTEFGSHRLECFARSNSFLHGALSALSFETPEFFKKIGPLIEWRKGKTQSAGRGSGVQCLMWL